MWSFTPSLTLPMTNASFHPFGKVRISPKNCLHHLCSLISTPTSTLICSYQGHQRPAHDQTPRHAPHSPSIGLSSAGHTGRLLLQSLFPLGFCLRSLPFPLASPGPASPQPTPRNRVPRGSSLAPFSSLSTFCSGMGVSIPTV